MPYKDKEKQKAYFKEYDKNRKRHRKRDYLLTYKYGITIGDYEKLLELQGNVCAICKNTETVLDNRLDKPRRLAINHCHTTGKVRGLLCMACNQALGLFRDNPEYLIEAASYVMKKGK